MKRVFRARLKVEKKWVYWNEFGELTTKTGKVRRLTLNDSCGRTRYYSHVWEIKHLIELETIGQYVCRDKKQDPIFEGDIVEFDVSNGKTKDTVIWDYGEYNGVTGFRLKKYALFSITETNRRYFEVIGNKWDNPEHLER